MNNGYQKSNVCGADKEGGKIFNTFFYPELQSKHVRPLAYNVQGFVFVAAIANCQPKIYNKVKLLTKDDGLMSSRHDTKPLVGSSFLSNDKDTNCKRLKIKICQTKM